MAAPVGNKYALGNNGGRPRIYNTPEELEKKIQDYFNHCDQEEESVNYRLMFISRFFR